MLSLVRNGKMKNKDRQTLSNSKFTTKQALDFSKTYSELKSYFALLVHFFKSVLDSEKKLSRP